MKGGCYGVNTTFNNILVIPFYWWRSTWEKPSTQGRIQDFVLEGAKVGEGSGDRLMSPAGPGQSRGRGLNLHSLLRNYLKFFGEDSCVLIHFITFTKCFKIVDGKAS
jgi:hypothetical protein